MPSLTTNSGAPVEESVIEAFAPTIRGDVIQPSDDAYDEARQVFNAMIDKRPGLIVRCAGVADVINSVNFARSNDLLIAVRGVGHKVAGTSVCDDGILIDLSQMKGMHIDPVRRTARVEPGLTWGDLNHDLQAFELAATGGFISTTGISGLTVGGGLGWLVRKHGLALDNLLSVDVVTADGRLLTASSTENEDLFWGIRGGGGNFGIVTSFEFTVHPAGTVLAGLAIHPASRATDALRAWREYEATAPEEVTNGALLFHAPKAPFLPDALQGAPVAAWGASTRATSTRGKRRFVLSGSTVPLPQTSSNRCPTVPPV